MSRNAEIERSFEGENWHAISTAPGWERRVVDALHEAGFAPYLPQVSEIRILRGKKSIRQRPVMPSYVFVRMATADDKWGCINRRDMEGVGALLRNHDRPSPIPQSQMDRVIACSDDVERILDWLVKTGRVMRVSNRTKKREAAWRRHLAKRSA
jgi:transcription antitermination factor NusG